jgi:glycosyltransferase involved in cell wall biosynthesis
MKILTIKAERTAGVPFYRQTQLMDYLKSKGHTVEDMIEPDKKKIGALKKQLIGADFLWIISPVGILLQEMCANLIKSNMNEVIMRAVGMSSKQLKANGLSFKDLRIVVDFDDEPITAQANSSNYVNRGRKDVFITDNDGNITKVWQKGKIYDGVLFDPTQNYVNIKSRIETLKLAHVFTSPSEVLLRQYGRFNKVQSLLLVPNAVNLDIIPKFKKSTDGKLRILWSMGSTHNMDFNEIAPAIGKLMAKDERIIFVTFGQKFDSVHIPEDRREHHGWVNSVPDYYKQFAKITADIGIAWVSNTRFNRAKSVIKAVEYMAGGLPVIASKTLYGNALDNSYMLAVLDNTEDLLKALEKYNSTYVDLLIELAYNYVKENFSLSVIGDNVELELLELMQKPLYPGIEDIVYKAALKANEPKKEIK